jgi:shikimate kinase
MGSGKSTIGRQLVEQFAARRHIASVDITEAVEEMPGFLSDCADE